MNPTMDARAWLLVVLLSILFGGSFFFVEIIVEQIPTFTTVAARAGLAALVLAAAARARGCRIPVAPAFWGAALIMGALNGFVPYSLIAWGQTQIDSGLAAILNATTPLFSVVIAHLFAAGERLTLARFGGVLMGIFGVAVIVAGPETEAAAASLSGQIAVLAAAASYACAGVYGRRFRDWPPAVAATGQVAGTAVFAIPAALILDQPWNLAPDGAAIGAMIGLALLSTALAYLIYFRVLAAAGATNVLLVTFLIPVSALALGVIALGEQPQPGDLAGLGLIFCGIAAIDGRALRWLGRHRRVRPGTQI